MSETVNETAAERVLREDIVTFINGCFAATGQAEFHQTSSDQSLSMQFVHRYVLENYRAIYALTLTVGINDFNTACIVENLLAHPLAVDVPAETRALEGSLIRAAVRQLPPQRVYRLFSRLRRRRVNNRRTRATIRDYLKRRDNHEFDAMKYRRGLADAARHAHTKLPREVGPFLFRAKSQTRYEHPLLEAWRAAHYSKEAVYDLPYTVAEGFAARHGIKRATFLKRIAPKMTRGERARLERAGESAGVDLGGDRARMPLWRLVRRLLVEPFESRESNSQVWLDELAHSAKRANDAVLSTIRSDVRVAAVLDNSGSSLGGAPSDGRPPNQRPLSVALGVDALLKARFANYEGVWMHPLDSPLAVIPQGSSNIADALIRALRAEPDLVVIVSDGYENDPPGGTHALLTLLRRDLDPTGQCAFVHANPVFDAMRLQPRALSSHIPTVGVRAPEDLLTMLPFARFASGHETADQLIAHLVSRVDAYCAEACA